MMVGLNIACFEKGPCNNIFLDGASISEPQRYAAEDAFIWWFVEASTTTGAQQQRARTQEALWKGLITAKSLTGCIFEDYKGEVT